MSFYYFEAAVYKVPVNIVPCLFCALELNKEKTCGIVWHYEAVVYICEPSTPKSKCVCAKH